MKPRYLIGIDPGTKTGVAVWDRQEKEFTELSTGTIIKAMGTCHTYRHMFSIEVRIEDARKRKWFGKAGKERLKGVGSINRDCSIWEEFCNYHGIPFSMIAPKDIMTKLDSVKFARLTQWKARTSEHSRDAGMIVFGV